MILEWLSREGGIILSWWALVTVAAAAALPLCMRLLGSLPDRGYTLARAAGVLLVAFVYWLLASLGFLRNSTDGMVLSWAIVLVIALAAYFSGERIDLRAWWRENRAVVIAAELLFAVLFVGWCAVRAYQNGIVATEKPMELAFISAVMRSETFPPNDPWMAGYAISYYYFGYVMAAMLSMLSGVPSTAGFNLMVALVFALAGLTVFGVVYNLVRSSALLPVRGLLTKQKLDVIDEDGDVERGGTRLAAILTGLLGAVLLVLVGNYQFALIELPYETQAASAEYFQFWDTQNRQQPRASLGTAPEDWDYWWFFRAARVIQDRNLDGSEGYEVIDEFPQFSFILADAHPHVLTLPFAVLGLGLALSVLLRTRAPNLPEILFYSVVIGGLYFLNTWDSPIYAAAIVGAEGVRRLTRGGTGRLSGRDLLELAGLGIALLLIGAILYLPFLINFRSQLGGALPNLVNPTRFQQYFLMFGPLLILIAPFLGLEAWRARGRMSWRLGIQAAVLVIVGLLLAMILLTALGLVIPALRSAGLEYVEANGGWGEVLPALLIRRVTYGFGAVILMIAFAVIVGRLFPRRDPDEGVSRYVVTYPANTGFVLVLIAMGILLTLIPDFVYLRDNFGQRMNTVFKLYYQGWVLFSVAAAYAVYSVLADLRVRVPAITFRLAYGAVAVVAVALGLLYPLYAIPYRTMIETRRATAIVAAPTLDGGATTAFADEYAAVLCLADLLKGDDYTVAEAIGGSYDSHNPPSGLTGKIAGIPVVMNWPGHESQWRGTTYNEIAGSRERDIDTLYGDPTWNATQAIISRYGIDYIFFGANEREQYGASAEIKFSDRLPVVCERGSARYYRTEGTLFGAPVG